MKYVTGYSRRTHQVRIGDVVVGGGNPVAVQSMTNTDTLDTQACADQIERIRRAGCCIVRLTTRTEKEAANLGNIRAALAGRGIDDVALVADVHFAPGIALVAADYADKVRVNPGNFRDPDGRMLRELIAKCRRNGVALRIGVNHGSLAPHIMDEWGDTPRGMVESAMEMLRVCRAEDFDHVVVSMKSSNVRVMVHAYRMLATALDGEGMTYPLHLGVTEAGDGADGRIKSAVGIGTLMADGIGDTIRVSLTEPPENEIPVALELVRYFERSGVYALSPEEEKYYYPFDYARRHTVACGNVGGSNLPVVSAELHAGVGQECPVILDAALPYPMHGWRARILQMVAAGDTRPVILRRKYEGCALAQLQLAAAAEFGPAFIDGLADGICIEAPEGIPVEDIRATELSILQAARVRMSKTEYIACPGCGRTLFDLQTTLHAVRERTSHLKKLKIGVMGCIVNGPGEMADADYGYVGSAPGMVTLYKGREVKRKSVPETEAVEALVELIKECGDWK